MAISTTSYTTYAHIRLVYNLSFPLPEIIPSDETPPPNVDLEEEVIPIEDEQAATGSNNSHQDVYDFDEPDEGMYNPNKLAILFYYSNLIEHGTLL